MQNRQWQQYQQLELIPSIIREPQGTEFAVTKPFKWLWRSLINQVTPRYNSPKTVEHLKKCWILDGTEEDSFLIENLWHFPSYATGGLLLTSDPNIWQTTNERGQPRWHIYEPKTGKISHWDTEEAVRTWLENRSK